MVLEKTLENPLNCKEIQLVHTKGDQSWLFIAKTDAEAETPVLWPPEVKNWLIWKYPDAGIDWGWEEKGTTEDEMFGWLHQLNGHGFGWTPGVGDGQGGLACSVHGITRLSDRTALNTVVHICQSYSPNLSHPPLPSLCPFSLSVSLFQLFSVSPGKLTPRFWPIFESRLRYQVRGQKDMQREHEMKWYQCKVSLRSQATFFPTLAEIREVERLWIETAVVADKDPYGSGLESSYLRL